MISKTRVMTSLIYSHQTGYRNKNSLCLEESSTFKGGRWIRTISNLQYEQSSLETSHTNLSICCANKKSHMWCKKNKTKLKNIKVKKAKFIIGFMQFSSSYF